MNELATPAISEPREMRCFPCCLGNHGRCLLEPCQCRHESHGPEVIARAEAQRASY